MRFYTEIMFLRKLFLKVPDKPGFPLDEFRVIDNRTARIAYEMVVMIVFLVYYLIIGPSMAEIELSQESVMCQELKVPVYSGNPDIRMILFKYLIRVFRAQMRPGIAEYLHQGLAGDGPPAVYGIVFFLEFSFQLIPLFK